MYSPLRDLPTADVLVGYVVYLALAVELHRGDTTSSCPSANPSRAHIYKGIAT